MKPRFPLYDLLLALLLPAIMLRLWWRSLREPGYRLRWQERFGRLTPRSGSRPCIWVHAVSVGEVQAARPLLNALMRARPDCELLVSTTTPTGARILRSHFDAERVRHCFFPIDLPRFVGRWLEAIRPDVLVLVETELWPNVIAACSQRDVPVALVNARMSERSARGYALFPGLTAPTLAACSLLVAQSSEDAGRLVGLGASQARCLVSGSIKFDVGIPASVLEHGQALRRIIGIQRPVLIAASTHAGEEERLIQCYRRLAGDLSGLFLILVPRHPDRADGVADLLEREGLHWARRSDSPPDMDGVEVYLGDTMGELIVLYAAADVAFVGGTLVDTGGHNMLEPAALGLPVVCGPSLYNFRDISERLQDCGALFIAADDDSLVARLGGLLGDASTRATAGDAGRTFFGANSGATETVMEALTPLLPGPQRMSADTARK